MNGNRLYTEPNNWQTAEVITKTKMNNLERGVLAVCEEVIEAAGYDEDSRAMTLAERLDDMETQVDEKLENVSINKDDLGLEQDEETNIVYVTYKGERSEMGVQLVGGSGGSGSGSTYTPRITSTIDRTFSVTAGSKAYISFVYTSTDTEGGNDGAGIGTVTVNKVQRISRNIPQGETVTIDVSNYLNSGDNTVRVKVTNQEGNSRILDYNITVVTLILTTTAPSIGEYSGNARVPYTVIGAGEKTIHFVLDGVEIGTDTVKSSGRTQSYTISEQTHGAHSLRIWAESTEGGYIKTEPEGEINISMIWIDESSGSPIVASSFVPPESIVQGETITIPYQVYDPVSALTQIYLIVLDEEGNEYSRQSIPNKDQTPAEWVLTDYPAGDITLRILTRDTSNPTDFSLHVVAYTFPIEKVTGDLELEFSAAGRSNSESNPEQWSYGEGSSKIEAIFDNFVWSTRSDAADGWLTDSNGSPVLRFLPGDTMLIPYKPFQTNFAATGYTIEVDIATHDVQDYNTLVISAEDPSSRPYFKIASQNAKFRSNESEIGIEFKEDKRVRITFSIESRLDNRFIYTYIDGVMSSVIRYNDTDTFGQSNPADIFIGAETCGLDLYSIRCYRKALNADDQLDNYIVDRGTLVERQALYANNNILGNDKKVTVSKLPANLPYAILTAKSLPIDKDTKIPAMVTFVDPAHPEKSFVGENATIKGQGTSSMEYPVKNHKWTMSGGFTIGEGANQTTASKYALKDDEIPVKTFCFKVDYASSENANNVVLVDLYEKVCRELGILTPPQQIDSRVRQGISGRPVVTFFQEVDDDGNAVGDTVFYAKGNLNNDKGTHETYGFTMTDEETGELLFPNAESWEFKNHATARCLFKSADFTGNWDQDFEARYPEDNTNTTRFARVMQFVADHDWTNNTVKTNFGTKAAMLADFKTHFEEYFTLDLILVFYLFTSQFLMIDNRSKNMFLTTYDGTHWFSLPYDFDTALGINNEGRQVFSYSLLDTDHDENEGNIYNGQDSVLWNNVREAYHDELRAMYLRMRGTNCFNYDYIANAFEEHQSAWPKRLWNEDQRIKYIEPTLDGSMQIQRLHGNKASQRPWWLYNAFKFHDSYWAYENVSEDAITFRAWTDAAHPISQQKISLTPYSDIYARVYFTDANNPVEQRLARNTTGTFAPPSNITGFDNTTIRIMSAGQLQDVGDLSTMNVGNLTASTASKLTSLILGNTTVTNTHLTELELTNNPLLKTVNICNCTALNANINLSGCRSLETLLATGSAITGANLPIGGHLQTLALPATTANITIRDQKYFETLTLESQNNLTTLNIENTPNIDIQSLINNSPLTSGGRPMLHNIRLFGIEWTATNEAALKTTIDRLDTCLGIDINGQPIDTVGGQPVTSGTAVVNGRVNITSISSDLLTRIQTTYPDLIVVVNNVPQYIASYYNYDKTLLFRKVVAEGGNAINPVTTGDIEAPTRPDEDGMSYEFTGWDALPTNIHSNVTINAVYKTTCRVRYLNYNDAVLETKYVDQGGSATYTGTTPTRTADNQYTYTHIGWNRSKNATTADNAATQNITTATDVYAVYSTTLRQWPVYWENSNGTVIAGPIQVDYGKTTPKPSTNPTHPTDSTTYQFSGWSPDASVTPITGETHCRAQYVDMSSPLIKYINRTITQYENDSATKVGTYAFYNYTTLTSVETSATTIEAYAFNGCSNITTADLTSTSAVTIGANAFAGCTKLTSLFVRSDTMSTLSATSALPTPFTAYNNGVIYVKDSLVNDYKTASNWSNFATHIVGISEYPATLKFDSLDDSWAEIIAAGANGTYASKYNVGDTKWLTTSDNTKVMMELVAKDTDQLSDDSGTAPMTWLPKDVVFTYAMNSSGTNANGWEACQLRTYLNDTYLPKLTEVASAIKEVKKTWYDYTTSSTKTSNEKLWIPSTYEMFSDASSSIVENSGVSYTKFNSNAKRVKNYNGSANYYWLRSAYTSGSFSFYIVNGDGSRAYSSAGASNGVVPGFCI